MSSVTNRRFGQKRFVRETGHHAGARTSGYAHCMMKDGDVPDCPGDPTTWMRHVIGEDPRVECTGATCHNDVTCAPPMLSLFADPNCSTPAYTSVPVDGNCQRLGQKGLRAFEYQSELTNQPVKDTPPTASVAYAETKTLCCPKED